MGRFSTLIKNLFSIRPNSEFKS